jgi:hypothetical protein
MPGVRSEPLDDAASHLAELAEEVESTRGHLKVAGPAARSLEKVPERIAAAPAGSNPAAPTPVDVR